MAFRFDPEQLFRHRPRVVRERRPPSRRRRITAIVIGILVVLAIASTSLMRLRVNYLFLSSLGHGNVFWTPLVAQVVLFLIGFAITAGLVAASVPFWARAVSGLDARASRIARWGGLGVAALAGIAGGASLAGSWQDVLLFLHGGSFGATDPVFGQDYGFYIFTLPVIDAVSALLWGGVIVGLIGAAVVAAFAATVINAPSEIDFPLEPVEGRTPQQALRLAVLHAGVLLVAVFVLAAAGAHFGAYHMTTSVHTDQGDFVGLDATQRNVTRPILGALQVIALLFGVIVTVILIARRGRASSGTGGAMAGVLVVWLVLAGILQSVPGAIYQGTSVNPNALQAQSPSINDYLTTSRYAWALQMPSDPSTCPSSADVCTKQFKAFNAPTLQDLGADPGTLRNVRIQDTRWLIDTIAQIDRSRSYQTYPTITVDRYPNAGGTGETEVMLGPREISEGDLPQQNFVSKSLIYTHGYGITAVSVNRVGSEGKPDILAGHQPLTQVAPDAPPALSFGGTGGDPRIYCGDSTTQPVVVNTTQNEFDYPTSGNQDSFTHAGPNMAGFGIGNPFDKLATSVTQFGGLDLFLTNALTGDSTVLLHREIKDRIQTLAPFLTVDQDPYIVADPDTNHLMWIADAYVTSDRFPEAAQFSTPSGATSSLPDGVSYVRNAVKAVIDARTCAVTLYAVDMNEPLTAAWNAIYPGLLTPLDKMPTALRQHLRYPEDLFQAQVQVYSSVHVTDPGVFFNKNDLYRPADEFVTDKTGATTTQPSQAYYVEMTPPGASGPQFMLLQTFSPGQSGSGGQANNMTAWLAADNDYTSTNHPHLIAVPLPNAANVLGALQFDNNINTNPDISREITLLGQRGSTVILGNVIILPFNQDSFLYVRPFYVLANSSSGGSFPQLIHVIVGTQNSVAMGNDLVSALQNLYSLPSNAAIPGLGTPSPGASPSPSPSAGPTAPPVPKGVTLTPQETALLNDLLQHEMAAEAAYARGDYATAGQEQAKVKADADQLNALLAQSSPSPSPSP